MTGYMARFGARLIENDYAVIPIMPGAKKPGRFTRGAWRDCPAWTRHCYRATTEHELAIWSRWPDAAIGIACGAVVGVDIDELDGSEAHQLEQRARSILGDTPLVRVGMWPKRMLAYRAVEPFGSISDPIEILCLGRQFVAFADHPDTGRPYLWPDASPADVPVGELPAVDLAAVHAFLATMQTRLPSGGNWTPACSNGDLSGTPEAIADALRHIPNADLDYRDWVKIGMAIKGALGEDGWSLFEAWSADSDKDVPAFTAKTWRYMKPVRIGAGTIYHFARCAGWTPAPTLSLNRGVMAGGHPAQALLDKLKEQRA